MDRYNNPNDLSNLYKSNNLNIPNNFYNSNNPNDPNNPHAIYYSNL